MPQYLLGHGSWIYVEDANEEALELTNRDFLAWEQATSYILYCLTSCVHDQMVSYIKDAKSPNDAWGNLKKIVINIKIWPQ